MDGLGWEPLARGVPEAPFLSESRRGRPFDHHRVPVDHGGELRVARHRPAASRHGLVGYTLAVSGYDRPMNVLRWSLSGGGPALDLRAELPPEEFQPEQTLFERAASHGSRPSRSATPSTRARASRARRCAARVHAGLLAGRRRGCGGGGAGAGTRLVYAYYPGLDFTGHLRGPDSDAWALELGHVDRIATDIADRLPPGAAMIVTGDHGMVEVLDEQKVDLARIRSCWRAFAWSPASPAPATSMRGPAPRPMCWPRGPMCWATVCGSCPANRRSPTAGSAPACRTGPSADRDVIAAAREPVAVVQRDSDGLMAALIGHHGSLTPAEQLVPLLVVRRD